LVSLKILELLSDGKFHSGQEIGSQLSISRAAVWKQMQKLRSSGVDFSAVRGLGYRIESGIELLSIEKITSCFSPVTQRICPTIDLLRVVDSTNTYARKKVEESPSNGTLIIAEYQSSGRGRRGKSWFSPLGGNIAFSLVWDFQRGTQVLDGLSLAVGVAVQRAFTELGCSGVQLKWPNDLLIKGKKIAGILIEMMGDPLGDFTVIIGIGINYKLPHGSSEIIDQPHTDVVSEWPQAVSRNVLCGSVVNQLINALLSFERQGFSPFLKEWLQNDALIGQECAINTATEIHFGRVLGVTKRGALRLSSFDGGENHFVGGELTLRSNA
tara:strand:+ start:756 stop:1733 length:978 start_codon:yes stop_codon:yes gene_type:complete